MASQAMIKHADTTTNKTTDSTSRSAIRDAMSLSNLLTDAAAPKASTPELAPEVPVLETPSTPKRGSAPKEDVPASPADTVMSDLTEENDDGEGTDQPTADTTDDESIEREFVCMNDEYSKCRTGQYTLALSRKVISDHFGRNKACTRDLK